ncbi:MAG: LacI family transcriptional regulator [Bacillota bacterium]|nr:LacI family transcriptional regulator [Bacillota bacterium]
MKVAKIEDVAKKTGYSITTISRAINNHPYVSEKAKAKIFKAMRELNYYPNNIAQQFRGQGTKMIGVVISFITNPFFSYLVDAIEQYLSSKGYQVVILQTLESSEKELQYIEMLQKKQLDGLIMANLENDNDEVKQLISEGKIVLCNRYLGSEELPVIHIDEESAAYDATEYLIKKGYTQIAFCTGGIRNKNDHRFIGFSNALNDAGLTFNDALFFSGMRTIEDGNLWINDRVKENKLLPDAVFANGDEVAAGMLKGAQLNQLKVPRDLAIMGFDDQPIAALLSPTLTTIHQPIKLMGEYTAQVLLANINGDQAPESPIFKAELVIRETT